MYFTTPIASNTTTTANTNNNITYTPITTTPESLFDLAFTEALKAVLSPNYDPNDNEQRKKIVAKSVKKMLNLLASDSVPACASSALTVRQQRYTALARERCRARGLKQARMTLRLASWSRALGIDISEKEKEESGEIGEGRESS
ncbi:hypothetical protein B0A48_15339 [Cryoendolithus antarcticus]|uniref:Uncharacterized protein n=1 Tax=Cryoendolithus antarcticus TaxID=1507870 RepID=A0A1V8SHV9_9PEZI|nr:hypothetical protein B0A48_15339 [Cryoendolithus antarcticus]